MSHSAEARLTAIEEALSHHERTIEDLSTLVAEQASRLDRAERMTRALLQRLDEVEGAAFPAADRRPPHW